MQTNGDKENKRYIKFIVRERERPQETHNLHLPGFHLDELYLALVQKLGCISAIIPIILGP